MSNLPVHLNIELKANLTKPIDEVTSAVVDAANFIGRVLGTPVEALGGIAGDQIQYWRAKNLERLKDKWLAMRAERGAGPEAIKSLPFGDGIRLFEAASQEDDDEVQRLWAGLLNSATDPGGEQEIKRIHIDILRSISGTEAKILQFLFLRIERVDIQLNTIADAEVSDFAKDVLEKMPAKSRVIGIQNLKRQDCVRRIVDRYHLQKIDEMLSLSVDDSNDLADALRSIKELIENASGVQDDYYLNGPHNFPEISFELTELGIDLMRTCNGPDVMTSTVAR